MCIRDRLFFCVASLLWFIFRTGTKPSRIVYPCQRAALANSSIFLGISIPLSLVLVLGKTKGFVFKKEKVLALFVILVCVGISSEPFWGAFQIAGAVDPNKEIELVLEPRNAEAFPASDIYVVKDRVSAHIDKLVNLMGSHGLLFYKSNTRGANQGPDGLIARDDVVLIKINSQWPYRGGTNTDVLKELIQVIVQHPEGFVGEIVVADNGQGWGSMNWPESNAENTAQSTQDVVGMFMRSYSVSTYDWQDIRSTRVAEYSEGDVGDGYILYNEADPETGIFVSYPKFRTEFGTYISFKYGIWNGTGYEKRLKVINMPVLKSHFYYGVTASLKHYMGVQSEARYAGLANGHSTVGSGGMGTLMVETGLPTLNIIDAIWINACPSYGPETPYSMATRVNVLMAGLDPVALDYWAAKHVLVQAASLIGYGDTSTLDPDKWIFGRWLNFTKDEIIAGGCNVTTDESHMNVHIPHAETPPSIIVLSPENKTYSTNAVPLAFTVNESTSWNGYSLDGQGNVTVTGNATIVGLSEGSHTITIYASDTSGNMGSSETVYFAVDTVPPSIRILSPENRTYTSDSVSLSFSINEPASWIGYSLDSQANITVAGNTTISGLADGSHNLILYANDTGGNMAASELIHFTVETQDEPQQEELFPPTWILATVAIAALVGASFLFYFVNVKKKPKDSYTRAQENARCVHML